VERVKTIELNLNAKKDMAAKGVQPVVLSQKGRDAFAQALAPAYRDTLEPLIGKDLLKSMRAAPDAPESFSVPGGLSAR
jgi:TRAP-type C4-dicarboxylate transport system substrate-binding protein